MFANFPARLARCIRQCSLQKSPHALAAVVERNVQELLGAVQVELLFFDADEAVLWSQRDRPDIPSGQGVLGAVVAARRSTLVENSSAEPLWSPEYDAPGQAGSVCLMAAPIVDAEGTLHAVVTATLPAPNAWPNGAVILLERLCAAVVPFFQALVVEMEAQLASESLTQGAHDALFNHEALTYHRSGERAGPPVLIPGSGLRAWLPGMRRWLERNRNGRPLAFVQQLEASDCGAACLAMVLRYLGSHLPVTVVRASMDAGPSGVSLLSLLDLGSRLDLIGRAIRVPASQFRLLSTGMVLHWEFNHLVVFERHVPGGVIVLDPAMGRRELTTHEFTARFTGLALEFTQGSAFVAQPAERHATWHYLRQLFEHPGLLRRALAASVAVQMLALALPVLTALVVDRIIPTGNQQLLLLAVTGAGAAALFGALAQLARAQALTALRAKFDQAATFRFVDHLLNLPYPFFQQRSPGDLMLRVYANASIREILSSTLLSAVLDGGMALIYAVVLTLMAPPLAAVVLVVAGLQVVLVLATRRELSELTAAEWSARSRANSKLVQVLHGIQTLKGAGAEAEGFRFWAGDFAEELNSVNKRQIYRARLDAVAHAFEHTAPVLVLGLGALMVMDSRIPLGGMLAAATLSAAFLRPLLELVRNTISLLEVQVHVERIHDVVSSTPESSDGRAAAPVLSGDLRICDLSFIYPGHNEPVIRGLSLTIPRGRCTAIVGETGCGKSTLLHLLLGFYEPSAGSIAFDDHDLAHVDRKTLRRQIGYVPQHPYLFEGSVRENIALSHPEASLHEIVEAARIACIHDDILTMDNGYDTRIIANGDSLSGGQRQRIALARALLGRPGVLILDEATSSLDTLTEARVTASLEKLACTRIVVAHRLSTVQQADVIVVMADGAIVEAGSHEELVRRKGPYAKLVSSQLAVKRQDVMS